MSWDHAGPSVLAAFLASLVEFVEALTVVLAIGSVRGWPSALGGAAAAVAVLLGLVAVLGSAMISVPLGMLQLLIGILLLLFGLRWLRKAILRAAGIVPLHDEADAFVRETDAMRALDGSGGWDRVAFGAAFQITMLEGAEVVFVVIAIGAGGAGLLMPASLGAVAALFVVVALGAIVRRPLARVPENTLKFVVGVLLSAFGCFWFGESIGLAWPGKDWSILGLIAGFMSVAILAVPVCRGRASRKSAAR